MKRTIFTVVSFFILISKITADNPTSIISDTVFVTASRVENRISNLPISSTSITKKELLAKSIGDVASALIFENGVDVRSYSLINSASQISLLGSSSQQVLVLLDGLPINAPSIGTPDLGLVPINTLNRIEIVKGPTSSLYGANALGGVINLITEQPFKVANPSYELNLIYGSCETFNVNFSHKNSINKYNYIINGHYTKTNGLRTNDEALTQGFGFFSGYNLNSNSIIRFDLQYENKEIGVPGPIPNYSQIPLYGDSFSSSIFDRQFDNFYLAKLLGTWQIAQNLELNLNSHYTINNSHYLWINQNTLDTSLYNDYYNTKVLNFNIISRYRLNETSNIVLGIDFRNDKFNAASEFPNDTNWSPSLNKFGIFAEGSYELTQAMTTIASLRYDYNSGFGNFFSPCLGITQRLNHFLKLRGHIGQAFRAPTLNDLYWPIYGNPEIKPEIGDAYQVGIDATPNNNFSFISTIFYRRTKNLIAWSPDSLGYWRPSNVDSASIYGIEISSTIKLTKDISLQIAGTFQKGYQIKKEQVYDDWISKISVFQYNKRKQANIPDITFLPSLNIENEFGTHINILGRFIGARYNYYPSYDLLPIITMQTKKLPACFILSCFITQKIANLINLKLNLENLFNNNFSEQFGNSINDRDYPRPGRSIFFGIEVKK